jgi:hypothetical protein
MWKPWNFNVFWLGVFVNVRIALVGLDGWVRELD